MRSILELHLRNNIDAFIATNVLLWGMKLTPFSRSSTLTTMNSLFIIALMSEQKLLHHLLLLYSFTIHYSSRIVPVKPFPVLSPFFSHPPHPIPSHIRFLLIYLYFLFPPLFLSFCFSKGHYRKFIGIGCTSSFRFEDGIHVITFQTAKWAWHIAKQKSITSFSCISFKTIEITYSKSIPCRLKFLLKAHFKDIQETALLILWFTNYYRIDIKFLIKFDEEIMSVIYGRPGDLELKLKQTAFSMRIFY